MPSVQQQLFTHTQIQSLLTQAQEYTSQLSIASAGIVQGFFDIITGNVIRKKQTETQNIQIDFSNYQDSIKLEGLRTILVEYRQKEKHKYKRMHYSYLLSLIDDRILELKKFDGKSMDRLTKLNHAIQPGDILLISKKTKSQGISKKLDEIIDDALRFFSHSIYMHIGIIGKGSAEQGYDRIHSTIHASKTANPGVQKTQLNQYLDEYRPEDILVVRYQEINDEFLEKMIFLAEYHAIRNSHYDTADALSDITGLKRRRDPKKYNCAEFVFDCLKAIDPSFDIPRRGVPGQYANHQKLEQVYVRRIT